MYPRLGADLRGEECQSTALARRDESFGRDLKWQFSPLLHSAERGDTQYELIPISEDEANRIVARIRETADPAD